MADACFNCDVRPGVIGFTRRGVLRLNPGNRELPEKMALCETCASVFPKTYGSYRRDATNEPLRDQEFFPPRTRVVATRSLLETALKVAGDEEITILGYTWDPPAPSFSWFCFDVGERKYAIWRATGSLYEVDEFGAVADDPIEVPS